MKYKISKNQSKALSKAIVIWKDRADGIKNLSKCPLCPIQLTEFKRGCGDCIIIQDNGLGCSITEYGDWCANLDRYSDIAQKHATLMYNRLVRLQSESEICSL